MKTVQEDLLDRRAHKNIIFPMHLLMYSVRGKKKKSKEYAGAQIHTVLRKLGKCLGGGPEKAKNS